MGGSRFYGGTMMAYEDIKRAILKDISNLTPPQRQKLINLLSEGDFDVLFPPGDKQVEYSNRGGWREWAAKNKIVSQLPEDHQYTSWLIWHHVGIEPHGSKKAWMAAITDLIEAAGGWMELVEKAIQKGKEARVRDGLTLKGPRSFIGWVRDLRGRKEMEKVKQLSLIDLDSEDREGGDLLDLS